MTGIKEYFSRYVIISRLNSAQAISRDLKGSFFCVDSLVEKSNLEKARVGGRGGGRVGDRERVSVGGRERDWSGGF